MSTRPGSDGRVLRIPGESTLPRPFRRPRRALAAALCGIAFSVAAPRVAAVPRVVEGSWDYYYECKESAFKAFSNASNEIAFVARRSADTVVVRSSARALRFYRGVPLAEPGRSGEAWADNLAPAYQDEAKNAKLADLAAQIRGDAATIDRAVDNIAVWVRNNIAYSLGSPTDPLGVAAGKRAFCAGYASLFVHLLRASGIEARELSCWVPPGKGWGFSGGGGDHAFLEYFYPGHGWVSVDPQSSCNFVDPFHLVNLDRSSFVKDLSNVSSFTELGAVQDPAKWETYQWAGKDIPAGVCATVSLVLPEPHRSDYRGPLGFAFLDSAGSPIATSGMKIPYDGVYSDRDRYQDFDRPRVRLEGVSPGQSLRALVWRGPFLDCRDFAFPEAGDLEVAADFSAAVTGRTGSPGDGRSARLVLYGKGGLRFAGKTVSFSLGAASGELRPEAGAVYVSLPAPPGLGLTYDGISVEPAIPDEPGDRDIAVFPSEEDRAAAAAGAAAAVIPAAEAKASAKAPAKTSAKALVRPILRVLTRDSCGFPDAKAFDSVLLFDAAGKSANPGRGDSGAYVFDRLSAGAPYTLLASAGNRHLIRSVVPAADADLDAELDLSAAEFIEIAHRDPLKSPAVYRMYLGPKLALPLAARSGRIFVDAPAAAEELWIGEGDDISAARRLIPASGAASGTGAVLYDPWKLDAAELADFRVRVRGEKSGFLVLARETGADTGYDYRIRLESEIKDNARFSGSYDNLYLTSVERDTGDLRERPLARLPVKYRNESTGKSAGATTDAYGAAWIPAAGDTGASFFFYAEKGNRLLCARAEVPASGARLVSLDTEGRLLEIRGRYGAAPRLLFPQSGASPRIEAAGSAKAGSSLFVRPPDGPFWLGYSASFQDAVRMDPASFPAGGDVLVADLDLPVDGPEWLADRAILFGELGLDPASATILQLERATTDYRGVLDPAGKTLLVSSAGDGKVSRIALDSRGFAFALLPPGRYEARLSAPGVYLSLSFSRGEGGASLTRLSPRELCAYRFVRDVPKSGLYRAEPSAAGDQLAFKEERIAADRWGFAMLLLGPGRHLFAAGDPRIPFEIEVPAAFDPEAVDVALPSARDATATLALLERLADAAAPGRARQALAIRRGSNRLAFAGAAFVFAGYGAGAIAGAKAVQTIRGRLDGSGCALVFPKPEFEAFGLSASMAGCDLELPIAPLRAVPDGTPKLEIDAETLPGVLLRLPKGSKNAFVVAPALAGGRLSFVERRAEAANGELLVVSSAARSFFRAAAGGPLWDAAPKAGKERPTLSLDPAKLPDQWSVAQRAAAALGPGKGLCLVRLTKAGSALANIPLSLSIDGGKGLALSTGGTGFASVAGLSGKRYRLEHGASGTLVVKEGDLAASASGVFAIDAAMGKTAAARATLKSGSGKAKSGELWLYTEYAVAKGGKASWKTKTLARTDKAGRLDLFLPPGRYAIGSASKEPVAFTCKSGATEPVALDVL